MAKLFTITEIAEVAHTAVARYNHLLGDTNFPEWRDAPEWQKASAIDGVLFHVRHPYAGPEASHENWLRVKRKNGWVWGEVKDEILRTHPCIMPFNQLPPEQQAKDWLFKGIVDSFIAQGLVSAEYTIF